METLILFNDCFLSASRRGYNADLRGQVIDIRQYSSQRLHKVEVTVCYEKCLLATFT